MNPKPDFKQLIDDHGGEIFAFMYRMLGNSADAEDCLQDTFLRAYVAYRHGDGIENFRAWLYKIAGNTARTRLRREWHQLDMRFAEGPSTSMSVEQQTEHRIWLDQVRKSVEALPHKQRVALVLRKYQGLSYAEIGEILDTSSDSARANTYQALKKLRDQFASEVADLTAGSVAASK